jgi:hypothetical protein
VVLVLVLVMLPMPCPCPKVVAMLKGGLSHWERPPMLTMVLVVVPLGPAGGAKTRLNLSSLKTPFPYFSRTASNWAPVATTESMAQDVKKPTKSMT